MKFALNGNYQRFLMDSVNLYKAYNSYNRRQISISHYPTHLIVETAGACNLSCRMCPVSLHKKESNAKGVMSFELFKNLIDEVHGYVSTITLYHGGEALLNSRLEEMVAYAKSKGMSTVLHTNGILMNEKRAKSLIQNGLDMISFSIDGYTADEYEKWRRGGKLELAVKGIKSFLSVKKDLKSKKPFTVLQSIEVNSAEEDTKRDFYEQFNGLPLDETSVIQLSSWGSNFYGGDTFKVRHKGKDGMYNPCASTWMTAAVLSDGRVVPCSVDFFGSYVYGSMITQTFEEIWFGDKPKQLRRAMVDRNYTDVMSICQGCEVLTTGKQLGLTSVMRRVVLFHFEHYFGFTLERRMRKALRAIYPLAKFR